MLRFLFSMLLVLATVALPARADDINSDKPLFSIVALLPEPTKIGLAEIRAACEKTFNRKFGENDDSANFVVPLPERDGKKGFLVKIDDNAHLVIVADAPYSDPDKAAAGAEKRKQPDLAKALKAHRAWVSVDIIISEKQGDIPTQYRNVGKLLAELASKTALAYYSTETGKALVATDELREKLRGHNPIRPFGGKLFKIIPIPDDAPEIVAAEAAARKSLPDLNKRFAAKTPDDRFAVKVSFAQADVGSEKMWVLIQSAGNGEYTGKLVNRPGKLTNVKLGDIVTIKADQIVDWVHARESGPIAGNFSQKVLDEYSEKLETGQIQPPLKADDKK